MRLIFFFNGAEFIPPALDGEDSHEECRIYISLTVIIELASCIEAQF
jgi:hypothetical protein